MPEPVTVGFTSGIAVVIAVLQLNDLLGLGITEMPEGFLPKLGEIASSLPQVSWPTVVVECRHASRRARLAKTQSS